MPIKGFSTQKDEKKRGEERQRGEEMGKTNISQGPEQIKGTLFSKTTKSGCDYFTDA